MWLTILDHAVHPAPEAGGINRARALAACVLSGMAVWAMYAAAAPLRLRHAVGITLPPAALAEALASAFVLDLFVFMTIFLAIAAAGTAAASAPRPGHVAYWLMVALLGVSAAFVIYTLVCASIAFAGRDAALASAALGLTLAAVWADLARLRVQRRFRAPSTPSTFSARRSRAGTRAAQPPPS